MRYVEGKDLHNPAVVPRGVGEGGRGGGRASSPLTVRLTNAEIFIGMTTGVVRFVECAMALRSTVNEQEPSVEDHVVGAVAELAVAKLLNRFFPAQFRQTDVGELEVRATTRKDGSLIVRENDSSAKTYVLAIVDLPRVRIVGCIDGWSAKRPEYWRAPNGRPGAYFVPQRALRSLSCTRIATESGGSPGSS